MAGLVEEMRVEVERDRDGAVPELPRYEDRVKPFSDEDARVRVTAIVTAEARPLGGGTRLAFPRLFGGLTPMASAATASPRRRRSAWR